MKRNLLTLLPCLALIAGSVFLNGCKEDDPAPPTASFTSEANGREVTFTNTSTNATTYAWDFGDGQTSTEESPKHTYDKYGKFTVKLTVTGDGGSATAPSDELTLAKTSSVVIDGSFSDWANVADVIVAADPKAGTMKKVKVDYDANNIYFYVEGTSNLRGFFDFYFDTDNDSLTGYFSGWYPKGFGADFLSEGDFALHQDGQIFKDQAAGETTAWGWDVTQDVGSGSIKSSALGTAGSGKAIEISFSRAAFTNLSAAGFAFAVVDVDGTVDGATVTWGKLGSLPEDNSAGDFPDVKMTFFDLTK